MEKIGLTVGELITKLSEFDKDGQVRFNMYFKEFDDFTHTYVGTVERVGIIGNPGGGAAIEGRVR